MKSRNVNISKPLSNSKNLSKCNNVNCDNEFEPMPPNKKYCCFKCRKRQYYQDNIIEFRKYNRENARLPKNYAKARKRQIEYNKKNKEYILLRGKRYELLNYEDRINKSRVYHANNKDKTKIKTKSYYQKYKKELKLQSKIYRKFLLCVPMNHLRNDFEKYEAMIK